jgi:acyl-CoA synthetase (AMP-forming)/AMP-acid ligase II
MHPDTLAMLYVRSCKWKGADVFFADPHERASGTAALAQSERIAAVLAALGVGHGERVAFLCKSSVRHTLAWFAGILRGAVACNLHVRETAPRLGETLDWLHAKLVIHDADCAALVAQALRHARRAVRAIGLDDVGWASLVGSATASSASFAVQPDDLGAILLSSGTTGRPKGVMHTQRTLLENGKAGQLVYAGAAPEDSTLILMHPSFAAWPNVVLGYVGGKARVVFGGTFSPQGFLETLACERITMAPIVPTMWRQVLAELERDATRYDLSALRLATISGEPPAKSDVERIRRFCPVVASVYLSSEGGCGCGVLAMNETLLHKGKAASTGRPVVHADLRIVEPTGPIDRELPRGQTGEIVLTGPSLAIGYWQDEALTREKFVDGWWRSGDLGWLDADGDLHVAGRTDNLINTGGIKVSGEEIERALLGHPLVVQAAVVGVADAAWGQRVEAHVVARDASLGAATLEAYCRDQAGLAGFKIPKAFHFVESLPTGPTGKLYRRALRESR